MDDDKNLTSKEAAEFLGCHDITLAKMRCARRGPPFFRLDPNKPGSPARYNVGQLRQWIADQQQAEQPVV